MHAVEFAQRSLFQQVTAVAQSQGVSAERLLATQRWQQITQSVTMMPGLTADQAAWMTQQQSQAISLAAAQRGVGPEAVLASHRWEQLLGMLQPPAAMPGIFPVAGMAGMPFDPNAR
jgi:hypothetical protein